MAWSYRQDRTDELYSGTPGVTVIEGKTIPETPASPKDSEEMLKHDDKKKSSKDLTMTEFQEFPGQSVPRSIEGDGITTKDKEIVENARNYEKVKANMEEAARVDFINRERPRIVAEEQERMKQEDQEKEREKLRKEIQSELKKNDKPESTNAKK